MVVLELVQLELLLVKIHCQSMKRHIKDPRRDLLHMYLTKNLYPNYIKSSYKSI